MNERPTLTDKLVQLRKNHDAHRSRLLRYWPHLDRLLAIWSDFERDGGGRVANVSIEAYHLSVTVHLAKVDSFKVLAPYFEAMGESGWAAERTNDDGYTRDYYFRREQDLSMAVIVWPDIGTHCERVLDKVEQREVFKLVCKDESVEA